MTTPHDEALKDSFVALREELRVFMAEQRGVHAAASAERAGIRGQVALDLMAHTRDVSERHKEFDQRLNALEKWQAKVIGAIGAAGVLGGLASSLVQLLFH